MEHINLDRIKSYESPPKIVKIFSEKEIKMIQELYINLPEKIFNKKQNIRKKAWIQNYNKDLDQIYFNKLKDVLGDFKMDTLISETGEDFYGLFHESFSPLKLHVDSGFNSGISSSMSCGMILSTGYSNCLISRYEVMTGWLPRQLSA